MKRHQWGRSKTVCDKMNQKREAIVTVAEEEGLFAVLEVVLDVPHLVVHRDEVLLVHPASLFTFSFLF